MNPFTTAWKAGCGWAGGRCGNCRATRKKLFLRYGLDQDFDQIIGPVDIRYVTTPDNYINHSCDPNLCYDIADNVVAARQYRQGRGSLHRLRLLHRELR